MNRLNYDTLSYNCPNCKENLNAATSVDQDETKTPRDGDISICVVCGCVLIFDPMGYKFGGQEQLDYIPEKFRQEFAEMFGKQVFIKHTVGTERRLC